VEVLQGLQPTDWIVVNPPDSLDEGVQVHVKQPQQSGAQGSQPQQGGGTASDSGQASATGVTTPGGNAPSPGKANGH
jgi:hypothetical protein